MTTTQKETGFKPMMPFLDDAMEEEETMFLKPGEERSDLVLESDQKHEEPPVHDSFPWRVDDCGVSGLRSEDELGSEERLDYRENIMDKGWAWVICGALSSMYLLVLGYVHVFGILFVAFQTEFSSSASVTASIMAMYAVAYSFMSLLSCNCLVERLSAWQITLAGGIIVAGGVAMGTFAQSIEFLMFTNGIMLGIGSALIFGPAIVIVGRYFDRRRTLAMSIVMAGASIGGMVLPPLTRFILDQYDVRGAVLIFGAVLLHVVPAAMLLAPPQRTSFGGSACKERSIKHVLKTEDKDIDRALPTEDVSIPKDKDIDKIVHTLPFKTKFF